MKTRRRISKEKVMKTRRPFGSRKRVNLDVESLVPRILLSIPPAFVDLLESSTLDLDILKVPEDDTLIVEYSFIDKSYPLPDSWKLEVPIFEEPLIDFSDSSVDLNLKASVSFVFPDSGGFEVSSESITGDIGVFGKSIEIPIYENHSDNIPASNHEDSGDWSPYFDFDFDLDSLEVNVFSFGLEGSSDFSKNIPLFDIDVPLGPNIPGLASLASLGVGFDVGFGGSIDAKAGISLDPSDGSFDIDPSTYAGFGLDAGLNGNVNAKVGNIFGWSAIELGGDINGGVGLDFRYLPFAQDEFSLEGSIGVGGSIYYDVLGSHHELTRFDWDLAKGDLINGHDDPTTVAPPPNDYSGITLQGISTDPAQPSQRGTNFSIVSSSYSIPDGAEYKIVVWPQEADGSYSPGAQVFSSSDGSGTIGPFSDGDYRVEVFALDETTHSVGYSNFGYFEVGNNTSDTMLVLDRSGSMGYVGPEGTGISSLISAANLFIDSSSPDNSVGIVSYERSATLDSPLTKIGDGTEGLHNSINSLQANGGTFIGSGIALAAGQLNDGGSILVMSDGEDYESGKTLDILNSLDPNITIYTVGLGKDVDRDFLTQIAEATPGGFSTFATDTVGLQSAFSRIQAKSSGGSLNLDKYSKILPGQSMVWNVNIQSGAPYATFTTAWPGSDLDMVLTSPSGDVITSENSSSHPGVSFTEADTYEVCRIINPEAGEWQIEVNAIDVKPEGEEYYVSSSVEDKGVLLPPDIAVSTDDGSDKIDFGKVEKYSPEPILTFNIQNNGEMPLDVLDISMPEGFNLVGDYNSEISAGDSIEIQVGLNTGREGNSYHFVSSGAVEGNIQILSNDPDSQEILIPVSGERIGSSVRSQVIKTDSGPVKFLVRGGEMEVYDDPATPNMVDYIHVNGTSNRPYLSVRSANPLMNPELEVGALDVSGNIKLSCPRVDFGDIKISGALLRATVEDVSGEISVGIPANRSSTIRGRSFEGVEISIPNSLKLKVAEISGEVNVEGNLNILSTGSVNMSNASADSIGKIYSSRGNIGGSYSSLGDIGKILAPRGTISSNISAKADIHLVKASGILDSVIAGENIGKIKSSPFQNSFVLPGVHLNDINDPLDDVISGLGSIGKIHVNNLENVSITPGVIPEELYVA